MHFIVSVKASFMATIISVTMAMLLFISALPGNTSAGAGFGLHTLLILQFSGNSTIMNRPSREMGHWGKKHPDPLKILN